MEELLTLKSIIRASGLGYFRQKYNWFLHLSWRSIINTLKLCIMLKPDFPLKTFSFLIDLVYFGGVVVVVLLLLFFNFYTYH